MFDCSKPKKGCLGSITKRWTYSSPFNVWKNDGQVCSMNDLVNLAKAIRSKPKSRCLSLIINRWVRLMVEKWCSSLFDIDKMVFVPSLLILEKWPLSLKPAHSSHIQSFYQQKFTHCYTTKRGLPEVHYK